MPPTKKFLLETQARIMKAISSGNRNLNMLLGASACAVAIKIQHALELLETQTLFSVQNYMYGLFESANKKESKAVQQLVKQPEFNQAFVAVNELLARKIENPKLIELKKIVEEEIKNNSRAKIIIFSQFRDTITKISKELNSIAGVNSKVFVGQAKKIVGRDFGKGKTEESGLSQREQREVIQEFSEGKTNVLCATSIAEEGLDIPEVNAVIFYEPIPSAIRKIQRAGRTARLMKGKLLILMLAKTRDEAYYWSAFHKEKKMYSALKGIKEDLDSGELSFNESEEGDELEEEFDEEEEEKKVEQKTLFDIHKKDDI
jgi:Fanconi anemia group M protein